VYYETLLLIIFLTQFSLLRLLTTRAVKALVYEIFYNSTECEACHAHVSFLVAFTIISVAFGEYKTSVCLLIISG